ncbi:MAG TPA: sulfatase [Planctomycetota bacterium]|nr:sulfatase [Planctomycetota bacterium]
MRTIALIIAAALAFFGTPASGFPTAQEASKPNLVVILADDLDEGSLETMLRAGLLPHIQRTFVAGGIRFVNSFVTNAVCAPSRATFLTGQYSHNHGVLHNGDLTGRGGVTALDHSSTLPVWLREAGYRTGHVGKYLNGYGATTDRAWVPPGWDYWQGLIDPSTYKVYGYFINDNGDPSDEPIMIYQTDFLAQRSVRFVHECDRLNDNQPFFLVVAPLAPHVEVHESSGNIWEWTIRPALRHEGSTDFLKLPRPPSFNELDARDKPRWLRERPLLGPADVTALERKYRDRLASLRAVDDLVGEVMKALEETGEADRTVLVLTADNGYFYGEHRLPEKLAAYEEAIRVPLYIRVPGLAGGREVRDAALNTDLAPTLVELAGATAGRVMDGRSLVPALLGGGGLGRKRFLVEHWMVGGRYTVPTYSAVRTLVGEPAAPLALYVEYREGEWGAREYYELVTDPYQLESRHDDLSTGWKRAYLNGYLERLRWAYGPRVRDLED